ncbi:hypothetical protein MAHJHV58_46340 [Mycobacterium avium subsp. hominissuis]|uniref:DUF2637 domain-containing protein n=1 Tax=Mycobacterium avium TaxID=1764 RepID=UPI00044C2416|nr:DUF2637 domain-containing protein [Mycobacterium avium]ETZ55253.1 hypothetical protein L838_0909 [Mycobacterium avium MAV_120709_2344]MDO2386124.1 DUF2637 domain-containing protein [Mycobacterium avium subsp. hominissuis]PBA63974.1 DUF2637 domain-containing protein [Mycobacterium avium]PBA81539.1 DUF2637 domain-containing protein [Mycobacterium avium]
MTTTVDSPTPGTTADPDIASVSTGHRPTAAPPTATARPAAVSAPASSPSHSGKTSPELTSPPRQVGTTAPTAHDESARRRAASFCWAWLILATAVSVVANVADAWLNTHTDFRVLAAIKSLVPPVILLGTTHKVFLLIRARQFGVAFMCSVLLAVLIAAAAFILSYEAIRGLVILLGTSPQRAGLWPVMLDLSIVNSTIALFTLSRRRPTTADPDETAATPPARASTIAPETATQRRAFWDEVATEVKQRNPYVRVINQCTNRQLADVLRLTHDDGLKQRAIVDVVGLNDRTVRAIQRAGDETLEQRSPRIAS